jgi:hypothetical protein
LSKAFKYLSARALVGNQKAGILPWCEGIYELNLKIDLTLFCEFLICAIIFLVRRLFFTLIRGASNVSCK